MTEPQPHRDDVASMTEDAELELRTRVTLLEQRVAYVLWIAIGAQAGLLALAILLALHTRSRGAT